VGDPARRSKGLSRGSPIDGERNFSTLRLEIVLFHARNAKVATTEDGIHAKGFGRGEASFQREQICVNIGDQDDSNRTRPSPRALSAQGLSTDTRLLRLSGLSTRTSDKISHGGGFRPRISTTSWDTSPTGHQVSVITALTIIRASAPLSHSSTRLRLLGDSGFRHLCRTNSTS
jgi:hypothetical protein